jgi:hypothetical protein
MKRRILSKRGTEARTTRRKVIKTPLRLVSSNTMPNTIEDASKISEEAAKKLSTTAIKQTIVGVAGPTKRQPKVAVEETIQQSITSIPFVEGAFRFIRCDRKKATSIQKYCYTLNKDNMAGWHFATRYDYKGGGLIVYRMDMMRNF